MSQRGFTLAEVLVAVGIIAIGLAGLFTVVPVASYALQEGNQLSTATFLADQRLEEVRNAAWTAVPVNDCLGISSGNAAPTSAAPGCNGVTGTTFPDESNVNGWPYARTVRVTDCAVAPGCGVTAPPVGAGARQVRVTITYKPMTGVGGSSAATKSVTLDMLVAQR